MRLQSSLLNDGFFILEAQRLFPLVDLNFTATKILEEAKKYGIQLFYGKVEVLRNGSIAPILCQVYSKRAVDEELESTNLFNTPQLLSRLSKGIELLKCNVDNKNNLIIKKGDLHDFL